MGMTHYKYSELKRQYDYRRVVKATKVHLLHNSDKFVHLIQRRMSELPRFLECHKEYSYLSPRGAKNKVEWVNKTMLIRKSFTFENTNPSP